MFQAENGDVSLIYNTYKIQFKFFFYERLTLATSTDECIAALQYNLSAWLDHIAYMLSVSVGCESPR